MTKRATDPDNYRPKRPMLPPIVRRWELWAVAITAILGSIIAVYNFKDFVVAKIHQALDERYVLKVEQKPLEDSLNAMRWRIKRIEREK